MRCFQQHCIKYQICAKRAEKYFGGKNIQKFLENCGDCVGIFLKLYTAEERASHQVFRRQLVVVTDYTRWKVNHCDTATNHRIGTFSTV